MREETYSSPRRTYVKRMVSFEKNLLAVLSSPARPSPGCPGLSWLRCRVQAVSLGGWWSCLGECGCLPGVPSRVPGTFGAGGCLAVGLSDALQEGELHP